THRTNRVFSRSAGSLVTYVASHRYIDAVCALTHACPRDECATGQMPHQLTAASRQLVARLCRSTCVGVSTQKDSPCVGAVRNSWVNQAFYSWLPGFRSRLHI